MSGKILPQEYKFEMKNVAVWTKIGLFYRSEIANIHIEP